MRANNYWRVKDIYSVPCATCINGKKKITVTGNWARADFADGARWYRRNDENSDWVLYREEVFTNC